MQYAKVAKNRSVSFSLSSFVNVIFYFFSATDCCAFINSFSSLFKETTTNIYLLCQFQEKANNCMYIFFLFALYRPSVHLKNATFQWSSNAMEKKCVWNILLLWLTKRMNVWPSNSYKYDAKLLKCCCYATLFTFEYTFSVFCLLNFVFFQCFVSFFLWSPV